MRRWLPPPDRRRGHVVLETLLVVPIQALPKMGICREVVNDSEAFRRKIGSSTEWENEIFRGFV